jgi:uncharacterized protein (TIGR02996 family)
MASRWFAKRFPRRLAAATVADFARMARNPSHLAPHPAELLHPGPFAPPGPPPLSPDERALLDAVLADPDADAPRLRYADWCDRRNDPRGGFIRAQMAEFQRGECGEEIAYSSSAPAAPSAVKQVLQWLAPWSAEDVVFRRGFAEALSLAGRAFLSLGDGLFRTAPIRDMRLVAIAPYVDELAQSPHLAKLRRLDLRGNGIGEPDADRVRERLRPGAQLLR